MESTLVLIKPDGVRRKLIGKIIAQFEEAELEILSIKMMTAPKALLEKHYAPKPEWVANLGNNTLGDYTARGVSAKEKLGTDDPMKIGNMIRDSLINFMAAGPIVAMVVSGTDAIRNVRRLAGHTLPIKADPGSIRGRFSCDSPEVAMLENRPIKNLVHASGNAEEAKEELTLWFPEM